MFIRCPGVKQSISIKKEQALFICDSLLLNDRQKIDFQVKPNRINNGVRDIDLISSEDAHHFSLPGAWTDYPFIFFCGKRIVFIDNQWKNRQSRGNHALVILLFFPGYPNFNPENLKTQIRFKQVIIDSSVPAYRAEQLIRFFQKEDIPCHSVRHEGAFSFRNGENYLSG